MEMDRFAAGTASCNVFHPGWYECIMNAARNAVAESLCRNCNEQRG